MTPLVHRSDLCKDSCMALRFVDICHVEFLHLADCQEVVYGLGSGLRSLTDLLVYGTVPMKMPTFEGWIYIDERG